MKKNSYLLDHTRKYYGRDTVAGNIIFDSKCYFLYWTEYGKSFSVYNCDIAHYFKTGGQGENGEILKILVQSKDIMDLVRVIKKPRLKVSKYTMEFVLRT